MSDQRVIYSTLRFLQPPSESQSRQRPGVTQRPGKTDDKVSWRLIAVTLGILCLLLLMTVTVLVVKIFQDVPEKHHQQEILENLRQKYHIMQNDKDLKEQLLTNKTLECDILKHKSVQQKKELASFFIENNRCFGKNEISSKSLQNTGIHCEDHCSCYGLSCYYFAMENKDWNGCKQTCRSQRSFLLKINDELELVSWTLTFIFILLDSFTLEPKILRIGRNPERENFTYCSAFLQPQTHKNYYWIGLSYDHRERKWKWVDDGLSSSGINSTVMSSPSSRGQCAFLSSTRMATADCIKTYPCICEKRIDFGSIFSASTCTKKKS
ncbi:killer cell lectin-like receptor 2 isoform X1 [Nycticebus coucang]|uniref:killer cell lectin-like receptor 2 isoform X1 n=1 Tax=Nycticebus coucang TaxID=9470 RepID=UPI00234D0E00|nr:killer cell lectin-like receptor 2 isoform X1 [Nycticebus coucang]XP_053412375.1 killer cell lectin-like receptor 2 isoform X1 [Nycticebus coucang]